MGKFYLTTAIDYVNASPHIGHALEKVQADVLARFRRLKGDDVFFLTGTDEHGTKIYRAASQAGLTPQEFCDRKSAEFKRLVKELNISNNYFVRTTEKRHEQACQKLWIACSQHIYKARYRGYYCVGCEAYLLERDLEDGLCPIHKTRPEIIEEENYFFRLSAFREKLLKYYDENPGFIYPRERFNEVYSFVEEGLEDVSISRSRAKLPWGIEVPGDPDQVMYVWFDALTNYISAVGYADDPEKFRKYWPANVHVIGKDISRFHCILWPAMLMSAGLPLPEKVFIHGFLTVEGEKMSKSTGNVVDPFEIISEFGADALRYYLIAEVPTTEDGDFSRRRFLERYNADLANDYGNAFYRMLKLALKNGLIVVNRPEVLEADDRALLEEIEKKVASFERAFEGLELREGVREAMDVVKLINKYIDYAAPWRLAREDKEAFSRLLYLVFDALRRASVLLYPVIPDAAGKMLESMGIEATSISLNEAKSYGVKSQIELKEIAPLFPRVSTDD